MDQQEPSSVSGGENSADAARPAGRLTEDERLLQPEQRPTRETFTSSDPWRVLRIMGEFVEGFDQLSTLGPAVTIFGSARVTTDDPMYAAARDLARRLAEIGFDIITGGGPGIMEAANQGAQLGGGLSVGCNIELPFEQGHNPYVDLPVQFRYFFVRKTMFVKYAQSFVIFPGGFGTLDELFEALTLIQTGKIHNFPVILFGATYWKGLVDWIHETLLREGKIRDSDLALFLVSDDPDEICNIIVNYRDREQTERRATRQLEGDLRRAARGKYER
jgi:uncharacterized protein (TIGR00730 family)